MRRLISNKKGENQWTAEEVVKIVFSVISILVLVGLGVGLYSIFTESSEKEQAKIHLERITDIISGLDERESAEYLITSPKDWYLVSYLQSELTKEHVLVSTPWFIGMSGSEEVVKLYSPAQCRGEDCLCFCPKSGKQGPEKISVSTSEANDFFSNNAFFIKEKECALFTVDTSADFWSIPYNPCSFDTCEKDGVCVIVDDVMVDYKTNSWGHEVDRRWVHVGSVENIVIKKEASGRVIIKD